MMTLIATVIAVLIILFIGLLVFKAFKERHISEDAMTSETADSKPTFKPTFINNSKLPKCQQANTEDFYNNFIAKTSYNDQVKNKRCGDIFSF